MLIPKKLNCIPPLAEYKDKPATSKSLYECAAKIDEIINFLNEHFDEKIIVTLKKRK